MSMFRRRLLIQHAFRSKTVMPIASYRCYDKTNDDTDRDVLKDLTGNGHDIQLYNFAFAESSGYGKYGFDLSKLEVLDSSIYDGSLVSLENNTIKFYGTFGELSRCGVRLNNISIGTKKFKFKCINIPEGKVVDVQIKNGVDTTNITFKNGINTFDFDFTANKDRYFIIYYLGGVSGTSIDITIEQIPDYQGALVSDGVDDYGLCENFPIFIPEKGFTICAIRKFVSKERACALISTNSPGKTHKPFIFEGIDLAKQELITSFSYINYVNISYDKLFSFMSSIKYNEKNINKKEDTNAEQSPLVLFKFYADNTLQYLCNAAIYALEIYDRDLTDEEIATVKARMIAEYEEKTGNKYEEEVV